MQSDRSEDQNTVGRTLFGSTSWLSESSARAHAMKNCLSVIRAIARLVEPEVCDRSRDRLARLQHATERLATLLDADLHDMVDPCPAPDALDVAALFTRVCGALRDRAEDACVTLCLDCAPASLVGTTATLEEAIFNLVANALESTPPGGCVLVKTSINDAGDHHWCVQDTGPGMPRDVLEGLGVRRCSRRAGGTGLGLVIAASAVRAHGGLLHIESCPGSGTIVTAWIPSSRHADAQ